MARLFISGFYSVRLLSHWKSVMSETPVAEVTHGDGNGVRENGFSFQPCCFLAEAKGKLLISLYSCKMGSQSACLTRCYGA